MAFVTETPIANRKSVFTLVADWFFAFGRAMYVARGAEERMRQIEKLNAKSDAELASLGLTREDIPSYVFRDIIHL